MQQGLLDITAIDRHGNVLANKVLRLLNAVTGEPAQLFADLEGTQPLGTHLVTTNEEGVVVVHCLGPIRVVNDASGVTLRSRVDVHEHIDPARFALKDATDQALAELREMARNPGAALTYAIELLTPQEQADVRTTGLPTINVGAKLVAWMEAAYLLYGTVPNRKGGQGCTMLFHPGSYLVDGFIPRPGMAMVGLASRYEIRILQAAEARQPIIDVQGRAQHTDDTQRRTDVFLQDLYLKCNGNRTLADEPINGIWLRPEEDELDDEDLSNRTGVIAYRVQCVGSSGTGFHSHKRGRNWLFECQFTAHGENGIFIQGPDCLLVKCYCGENGKEQIHVKSSATPMIDHVELGPGANPHLYPALRMERCTDFVIQGGNCTGWMLIENGEGSNLNEDYGLHIRAVISNVIFTFKDKTFQAPDNSYHVLDGYIVVKNSKGLHITGCRFKPAEERLGDPGNTPVSYHYTRRPRYVVYVQGDSSNFSFDCPLPALSDPLWPAGDPTVWPGSQPVNSYDSITNKQDQAVLSFIDPDPAAMAWMHNRLKFMPGGGIVGIKDGTAVAAGYVGELISTEAADSQAVALADGAVGSLGSVNLTAGNWDVRATLVFQGTAATATRLEAGVASNDNSISATSAKRYAGQAVNVAGVTGPLGTLQIGAYDLRLNAAATRYLNARAAFSAGAVAAYGVIEARRVS